MSHFLDRLTFFKQSREPFADGHGITTHEDRGWEDAYCKRWQHDKIVRSTHGANCTGSCSWKIYVKGGIVTWETQQTDYPRTRPELPNHEPRGCSRGASYSWYLYSGNRVKYPLARSRLLRLWREARATLSPVAAWASSAIAEHRAPPPRSGRPYRRATCAPASVVRTDSGRPSDGPPERMSTPLKNVPRMHGAPGRTSCAIATPERVSATSSDRPAARADEVSGRIHRN